MKGVKPVTILVLHVGHGISPCVSSAAAGNGIGAPEAQDSLASAPHGGHCGPDPHDIVTEVWFQDRFGLGPRVGSVGALDEARSVGPSWCAQAYLL